MAIEIVRTPSDTPNIVNTDDFIGLRYAYGNQRGYVKSKGSEIGYSASLNTFTITSGRMVIDGVEVDVDADGSSVTIDNIAIKRYFTVYLEVNLSTTTATIKSQYQSGTYPTIANGDDLTSNTIGTANLVLYTFDATSGVVSNVVKKIKPILYLDDYVYNDSQVVSAKTADNYNTTSGGIKDKFTSVDNSISTINSSISTINNNLNTKSVLITSNSNIAVYRTGNVGLLYIKNAITLSGVLSVTINGKAIEHAQHIMSANLEWTTSVAFAQTPSNTTIITFNSTSDSALIIQQVIPFLFEV